MDPLNLLTLVLVWAAVGLFLWYLFNKIIPKSFMTVFGMGILLALIFASFAFPTDETIGTIWHIISFPLTPLGAAITILALSFKQMSFKDGFKNNGQYVAIALAILVIASMPILANLLVYRAERAVQDAYDLQQGICQDICPATIPDTAPLGAIDSLVIMGDNIDNPNSPLELRSRSERTDVDQPSSDLSPILVGQLNSAAQLYQRIRASGANPFIVVTAGPIAGSDEEQQEKRRAIRQVLEGNGVPIDDGTLFLEDYGLRARSTMLKVRDILEEKGLLGDDVTRRIVLVAPALTMRRAALTFEKDDALEVVAWPTNFYGRNVSTEDLLVLLSDLIPNVEALWLTSAYWNEFLTTVYYFLRGWLPHVDVRWSEIVELVPR
jgi:uncharacterized SAM-binding protein YcdF (DUF218 family)